MLDRLHPFVVHFPIALLVAALLLELLRRRSREQAGEWMVDLLVALAAVGAIVGATTGDASRGHLDLPSPLLGPVEEHARAGSFAAWVAGLAFLLRLFARLSRLPRRGRAAPPKVQAAWAWGALLFLAIAALAALRAGYLGGRLVHELGVTPATIPSRVDSSPASPSTYESGPDAGQ